MIVDTIAGLAAPTALAGCPYHGIATGGVLPLPGGKQKSYPVRIPLNGDAIGRSRVIQPPWAKAGTLPRAMRQRGLSLQAYATINGAYSTLYGVELGPNNWLWAEAPGKVWLVDASELTDPNALSGKTFVIRLKRFGWMGGLPPDREMQRTLTFAHFVTRPEVERIPDIHIKVRRLNDQPLGYALADTHPVDGHSALFTIGVGYLRACGVALLDLRAQTLTLLAGDEVYWDSGIDRCDGQCSGYGVKTYLGQCTLTYDRKFIVGAGFSAEAQPKILVSRSHYEHRIDAQGNSAAITRVENLSGGVALQSLDGDVYDERSAAWRRVVHYVGYQGDFIQTSYAIDGTGLFGEALSAELYPRIQLDSTLTRTPWFWANAISYSPQDRYTVTYLSLSAQMVALVKYENAAGPELLNAMQIIKAWRCGHSAGTAFTPPIRGNFTVGPHSWLFATFSSDPMTGEIMARAEGVSYRV